MWIFIIGLLYLISFENYLLFHTVIELFCVYVAYVVFLIVWKSKAHLENRYLVVIGIAYFFVGSIEFFHALTLRGMELFPGSSTNLTLQLWIAGRYIESASFLIAPLFLMRNQDNGMEYSEFLKNNIFAWKVFLIYAVITISCLLSIFFFRTFPDNYTDSSGITNFKISSEYLISVILLFSLFLLYVNKDKFEKHVFDLLAAAIGLTVLSELLFTGHSYVDDFKSLLGHYFNFFSFYLIYKAVVDIGFEEPCSLLFRELKIREEEFRQKVIFLGEEYYHICKVIGVNKYSAEQESKKLEENYDQESYHSFMEHFPGIKFQLDEHFKVKSIHGPVKEITGYKKEDILSGKIDFLELIEPEYQLLILEKREKLRSNPDFIIENEFKIRRKNGEIKWVREIIQKVSRESKTSFKFQGLIYDITERKIAEETLKEIDKIRIKEIHHRIKNNLQVVSSLLSLQAEKFEDENVLEAFRESQNRVASIAMIHEELHEGDSIDTLDFADYLRKLTSDLFSSYHISNNDISLKMELEQVYLGMDTAIPLGIIVNELISNSLKHAFSTGKDGEVCIKFHGIESFSPYDVSDPDRISLDKKDFKYKLIVQDNGKGFPEEIDLHNANTLGLQLINVLVEQIDGYVELKRNQGTQYVIWFSNEDK